MKLAALFLAFLSTACADYVTCPFTGNFTDDPPHDLFPLPNCQDEVDPIYEMYTRTSRLIPEIMTRFIVPSNFQPDKRTLLVVHGWGSSINSGMLSSLKDAFLDREDGNVILVGWGSDAGAGAIRYSVSASTTRTVGADLGDCITNLVVNGGGSYSRMWCSGHSLGSHVCGYMGKRTNGLMYRITGLDPAGPLFANNTDDNNELLGLRASDADFVDTINTDGLLGSSPVALGQQNFFPNGGSGQPGCITSSCDHGRAPDLFEESIRDDTNCLRATNKCGDGDYYEGQCEACVLNCPVLGYGGVKGPTGAFWLGTNGNSPYCI